MDLSRRIRLQERKNKEKGIRRDGLGFSRFYPILRNFMNTKMKCVFAITAGLFAGASAFTGTPLVSRSAAKSELSMSVFDDYVGASDYRGKKFEFDPVSIILSHLCSSGEH